MLEKDTDSERTKKRQLEREINELNIQLNSQKIAGTSAEDSTRTKWLRDEIAKKQSEIQSAQRSYKDLIESKFDEVQKYSPKAKKSEN